MTEAVLFDLDGTLADTAPDFGGALNRMLVRHRRLPLAFGELRHHITNGSRAMIQVGFEMHGDEPEFDNLRTELLDEYLNNVHEHTALFPGIEALLESLEARNIPWGIVTNKPSRFTNPLLQSMQLTTRAACIVSAHEVARAKPFADPILRGCEIIGVDPVNCVYVGDDLRDVQAARAARMRVIGVRWGYIAPDDNPERWGADLLVSRADEIDAWLQRQ